MADLSDFHDVLRDYVSPVPPKATINKALIRSLREFCRDTGAYKTTITLRTTVNVPEYTLDVPSGMELLSIDCSGVREVGTNNFLVQVAEEKRLRANAMSGQPRYVIAKSLNTLKLSPAPSAPYVYEVTAIVRPALTATNVSDDLFNRWAEDVIFGAVFYLSIQKGKEWYDLQHGFDMKALFEKGKSEARNAEHGGLSNEALFITGNGFIL